MRKGNIQKAWLLLLFMILSPMSGTSAWGTVVSLNADTPQLKGREFGLTVKVDEIAEVFGIACDLVYDPEFLEVVEIGSGPPVEYKILEGVLFNNNDPDNNPTLLRSALEDGMPGVLVLGLTRSGNIAGAAAAEDTEVVTVSFIPKKVGTTTITFKAQDMLDLDVKGMAVASWDPVSIDITILKGDVDGSYIVDLADAVKAIKILNNIAQADVNHESDVNGDDRIGLADVIYILQRISDIRDED